MTEIIATTIIIIIIIIITETVDLSDRVENNLNMFEYSRAE